MAITQDYIAWATGNDYKGATFTDGAFTVADMTLTKAGAFTASKANHWLYLDDNGSGEITTGYYRIASVTSADAVVLADSPKSGANDPTDVKCTQHAGTALLPWRSDQGAADLCTRNATDGNQFNVVAGAAVVHSAPLDLTTFIAGGALANAGPLIFRGCTATANDGGFGEIDAGGATLFAVTTYDYVMLLDLTLHNFGNNVGVQLDSFCVLERCTIHAGASAPTNKNLVQTNNNCRVSGCHVYGVGAGNGNALSMGASSVVEGNYVLPGAGVTGTAIWGSYENYVRSNTIVCGATTTSGISLRRSWAESNIIYNITAGTATGIVAGNENTVTGVLRNNIVCGFSGAGGKAVSTSNYGTVGYNAFYNNTANYSHADQVFHDLTANDVALAADPFTDAANGDFSLTSAAKTALADQGWPGQYLGAHANTDSHLNIGPIQLTAGGAEAHLDSEVLDTATTPGTVHLPDAAEVISTAVFGVSSGTSGTVVQASVGDVQSGVTYGPSSGLTGTFAAPAVTAVLDSVSYGAGGTEFTGTYHAPDAAEVIDSAVFGPSSGTAGTYDTSGTPPSAAEIADAVWDELRSGHVAAGSFGAVSEWASTGGLDAAGVRAAVGLASANLDTQLAPLADLADETDIADALLARDLGSGTNAGAAQERTVRSALRFLRNKWTVAAGTLTVTTENDTTTAWTAAVTGTAGADPITGSDPT